MTDSVGYVAGKQRPNTASASGSAPVVGSISSVEKGGRSTLLRVTLPQPFGSFKVGEYTTGDEPIGHIFTNAYLDLAQAQDSAQAGGSALIDGESSFVEGDYRAEAYGASVVDGSSAILPGLDVSTSSGSLPISGDLAIQSSADGSDAVVSALIDGESVLAQSPSEFAIEAKSSIEAVASLSGQRQSVTAVAEGLSSGVAHITGRREYATSFGKVAWPIGPFGFQNTETPTPDPLRNSAAAGDVEADLRRLFCDLFDENLSHATFDATVLGAAHLGSLDLVRRAVNADGLVLMQGDRESPATRYLYRAWKASDNQGRGLHFLRTYLQVLFPNACEVNQLWQDKALPYPTALYAPKPVFAYWLHQVGEPGLKLDGSWGLGRHIANAEETRKGRMPDTSGMVLTSRIEIALDFSVNVRSVSDLMRIIRSVIPARLLPVFKFNLSAAFRFHTQFYGHLEMQKDVLQRYPWPGRTISNDAARKWRLGADGEPVKLPASFGAFRVGQLSGHKSSWRLKGSRIDGRLSMEKSASAEVRRVETIPPDPAPQYDNPSKPVKLTRTPRLLDGSWALGAVNRIGRFKLDGRHRLRVRKMAQSPRISHFKIIPNRSPSLLAPRSARLSLSGNWKLGGPMNMGFELIVTKVGGHV